MNLESHRDYELFSKINFLKNFKNDEIKVLYSISKLIHLNGGDTLINEGEPGDEIFFILDGQMEVIKQDATDHSFYVIDSIASGDLVGELSFIDKEIRSASIKAKTEAWVRSISLNQLEALIAQSPEYSRIYIHLSNSISQKMGKTSIATIEALRDTAIENELRARMGMFLVYNISALCVFSYALDGLYHAVRIVQSYIYVALPLTVILGASILLLMKFSKFSWADFGLTLTNWKKAVFEGVFLAVPCLALFLFLKWMFIQFDPDYTNHPFLNLFDIIKSINDQTWHSGLKMDLIYIFLMIPIQELFARGSLQGLFERFLTGKHKVLISIVASNLIFSVVHLYFSVFISMVVFFGGLYIGWIYSRTHSLIGSSVAHTILAIWYFLVFGTFFSI